MSLLTDFKKFLLRGNVVDLAVAVVIGTAFAAVVSALVRDLLTPINALMERRAKEDPDTRECPECTSAIPIRAIRCPMCTAQIPAVP